MIVFPLILCHRLNGMNCVIALLSFLSFFAISDLRIGFCWLLDCVSGEDILTFGVMPSRDV